MRRIARILLGGLGAALLLASPAAAGPAGQDSNEAKYEKKLQKEFISYGGWVTDYDEARARAEKEGKVLFVYFSRSYAPWPPCDSLEGGALSDKKFPGFADKVVPFLHITTRIPGHPYDGLLGEKGGTGFPTLMFLDAKGNQLLKHRGPRSVGGFEASLEQVEEFQALTRKAEAGDQKAAAELFVRQLQLGWFELDAARKRYGELTKVSSKQKKAIEQLLIDLEVRSLAEEAGDDLAARVKAGAAFQAMWKDKRIPEGAGERYSFWTILADYAWEERDKALFKKVVTQFEKTMSMGSSYNKKTLKALEARLKGFPK